MRKTIFSIVLLLALALSLYANDYHFDRSEEKHIRYFAPKKKTDLPPNTRKCMNVKCKDGFKCFHGRCIQKDDACDTIKCPEGFRCVKGQCRQRRHKAKKIICPPLNFKLKKVKCTRELRQQCQQQKITQQQAVCGFSPKTREYHDYWSPCDACTDQKTNRIRFYYETSCDGAPRICQENEQCMNGMCTSMLNDPAFDNCETCNKNSDCEPFEYCAAHKCIDKRDLFNYLDSEGEEKAILIKVA